MTISDKDLLEAIYSQKDEAAFKVFYDRYAKLLHNWATKRTGNKEVSNDVVQNFWIIFWTTPYAIKVDENGRVTSATYQPRGSTTSNASLKAIALRKANQVKFNSGGESAGTLIFNFRLKN